VTRPEDCEGIEDVCRAIDELDRETIQLFGRRAGYGEQGVRASEPQRTMLEARRRWAEENGLDPDVIEDLYRNLVSYFINREMNEWRKS